MLVDMTRGYDEAIVLISHMTPPPFRAWDRSSAPIGPHSRALLAAGTSGTGATVALPRRVSQLLMPVKRQS